MLECTAELLASTPWRSIKVIDIAREAGTSPATFYQYFENVEQAILVLAEELTEGAGAEACGADEAVPAVAGAGAVGVCSVWLGAEAGAGDADLPSR